jgi:hypothetical protein
MKWLTILAAIGAAALALQILIWERRGGRRRPSMLGQLALAVLTVVVLGAALSAAHWLGIFSVPLVIIAFVPFGIAARWLILSTRESRRHLANARLATLPPPARSDRLLALAAMPVFLILIAAVLLLGLIAGTLVGPH